MYLPFSRCYSIDKTSYLKYRIILYDYHIHQYYGAVCWKEYHKCLTMCTEYQIGTLIGHLECLRHCVKPFLYIILFHLYSSSISTYQPLTPKQIIESLWIFSRFYSRNFNRCLADSFTHLLMQQIFTECLLHANSYIRCWRYNKE